MQDVASLQAPSYPHHLTTKSGSAVTACQKQPARPAGGGSPVGSTTVLGGLSGNKTAPPLTEEQTGRSGVISLCRPDPASVLSDASRDIPDDPTDSQIVGQTVTATRQGAVRISATAAPRRGGACWDCPAGSYLAPFAVFSSAGALRVHPCFRGRADLQDDRRTSSSDIWKCAPTGPVRQHGRRVRNNS